MADAMVTARMSQSKKDAATAVLNELGISTSAAINDLFDYLIASKELPVYSRNEKTHTTPEQLREALDYIDSIPQVPADDFDYTDKHKLKRMRLISRGLATEEDFA